MYLYLIHFFILPDSEKIAIMKSGGEGYEAFNAIKAIFDNSSGMVYVTLSQILLNRHRKNIKDQFSTIEKINLNWLQYIILGICLIWVVVILCQLFSC